MCAHFRGEQSVKTTKAAKETDLLRSVYVEKAKLKSNKR